MRCRFSMTTDWEQQNFLTELLDAIVFSVTKLILTLFRETLFVSVYHSSMPYLSALFREAVSSISHCSRIFFAKSLSLLLKSTNENFHALYKPFARFYDYSRIFLLSPILRFYACGMWAELIYYFILVFADLSNACFKMLFYNVFRALKTCCTELYSIYSVFYKFSS